MAEPAPSKPDLMEKRRLNKSQFKGGPESAMDGLDGEEAVAETELLPGGIGTALKRLQVLEKLLHSGDLKPREYYASRISPVAREMLKNMATALGVEIGELLENLIYNFYLQTFTAEHLVLADLATFADGLTVAVQEHTEEVRNMQLLTVAAMEQEVKIVTPIRSDHPSENE